MHKLLSIVIPVYNVENYLDRCIESVVNQTYKTTEIIIVDDGSLDSSSLICDNWGKKDSRIRVFHKNNGGLSDARNYGIEVAKGDYIAFVDSDDFLEKNMYSMMIEALERTNSDIATCGRYFFKNGEKKLKHISDKELVLDSHQAIDELLRGGLIEEAAWDKIYRKNIFYKIRFPVGEINEDMPIMPFLIERASRIVCTGKPYYYYCENPHSITHAEYNEAKRVVIKHIENVSNYIKNKYPELNNAVCEFEGRYASGMLPYFEKNPKLKKKYKNDYQFFREYAIKNAKILLESQYRSKAEKIELICALLGVYRLAWMVKKKIQKMR